MPNDDLQAARELRANLREGFAAAEEGFASISARMDALIRGVEFLGSKIPPLASAPRRSLKIVKS